MSFYVKLVIMYSIFRVAKKFNSKFELPQLRKRRKKTQKFIPFPDVVHPHPLSAWWVQKSPQGAPKVMDHIKVVPEPRRMERWCEFVGDPKWGGGEVKKILFFPELLELLPNFSNFCSVVKGTFVFFRGWY